MMERRVVFKLLEGRRWAWACVNGAIELSGDDARDGYIHLSSEHQVAATAKKHFAGRRDLVAVAFDADRLGGGLRWEPSRGGEEFPHFYGQLPVAAALWARPMPLAGDVHHWPLAAGRC